MADSTTSSPNMRAARALADLLAGIAMDKKWPEVELSAQTLADGLRNRGGTGRQSIVVHHLTSVCLTKAP